MIDRLNFEALPVEQLWDIYHDIRDVLTDKLREQKRDLDNRLRSLSQPDIGQQTDDTKPVRQNDSRPKKSFGKDRTRRAYPKVMPLYRNPSEPSETWSGRGNKPRWLAAQVNAGRDIEEFLINKPPSSRVSSKSKSGRQSNKRRDS